MPVDAVHLPLDASRMLTLAAQSLFDAFASTTVGALVVDCDHRMVGTAIGDRRPLPAPRHAECDFAGRRVEDVVRNPLMGEVVDSGQPIVAGRS